MNTVVQIRFAKPEEASEIARILKEAFTPFEQLYTPEAFDVTILDSKRVEKRFAEKGRIWVALRTGEVIGTVSVVDEGEKLYIRSMAVSPVGQGLGIGLKLLEEIEHFASANDFKKLFLYTTPFLHNAIRLYERNGFRRLEDIDGFFGTPLFEMEKISKL